MSRVKVQVTLPKELKLSMEREAKDEFMPLSHWVERTMVNYFNEKERKKKKVIDLGI